MTRKNYREGDWFAVPLRDGGFAAGVVARANRQAALLGYFFGPRRDRIPSVDELSQVGANDAVLIGMFSDLGLLDGTWPLVGRITGWDRRDWPMPVFVRHEELTGRSFNVVYDDDPGKLLREELTAGGIASDRPVDGLMGAGYVENVLTARLKNSVSPRAPTWKSSADDRRVVAIPRHRTEASLNDISGQHAVTIRLKLRDDGFGDRDEAVAIMDLGDHLRDMVETAGVGQFDGDEFGLGYAELRFYGPDADRLADVITPEVLKFRCRPGSYVVHRLGPPGAPERHVDLGVTHTA